MSLVFEEPSALPSQTNSSTLNLSKVQRTFQGLTMNKLQKTSISE